MDTNVVAFVPESQISFYVGSSIKTCNSADAHQLHIWFA